jgi:hypothetical protein
MSRSNPSEGTKNPTTRWFEWSGGDDGGFVRYYNKDTKQQVKVDGAFTFLLLEELSTVKGWHEPSESSIFANEVKDTRQDVLVVKAYKGGELASGLYEAIKDKIHAKGGHYHASIYIAYKDGDELKLGNLGLKGAALGAWMDFKKKAATKKHSNGKTVKAYYVDAVTVAGYEEAKKGATVYRVPKFALKEISKATNDQALSVDAELSAYLSDYLRSPKADAAKPDFDDEPQFAPEEHLTPVFEDEPF